MKILYGGLVTLLAALIMGGALWVTRAANFHVMVLVLIGAWVITTLSVTALYLVFAPHFKRRRQNDSGDDSTESETKL
ncbi:hypothetical protein [Secundilactobacillus kimchicus]|nr:hypothetical protein [Secundilactobacillus kimchicus]MBT9671396.1 hypothetical protein [Secundilactobacillus kimchicus]